MENQPKLNLLDLPKLPLEKIFTYCRWQQQRTLLKLTECCKFLKNFIETNPQLKKFISLKIRMNYYYYFNNSDQMKRGKEILKACCKSTRKYELMRFEYYNYDLEDLEESQFYARKLLPLRHCETIKGMGFIFDAHVIDDKKIFNLLKCLEKLTNVEKVDIRFWVGEDVVRWDFHHNHESHFEVACENSLKSLKYLEMNVSCSSVLSYFGNCKSIEHLELISNGDGFRKNFRNLEPLLANSKTTLKTFKYFVSKYPVRSESSELNIANTELENVNDLLITLLAAKLDLKNVEFAEFPTSLDSSNMLIIFLKQQKNLENLKLSGSLGTAFYKRFGEVMAEFGKLKTLELLMIKGDFVENSRKNMSIPWNLPELEELKVICGTLHERRYIQYEMLQIPSDKLKKISIVGSFKLGYDCIENISKNYGSLVELEIGGVCNKCSDYSCNDIFWILRNLKKLKILKFAFPKNNTKLIPDEFDKNEDLKLLYINEVELTLNDSVKLDHAVKLIQLMSNMSKFCVFSTYSQNKADEYWKTEAINFLNHITKELPNLTNLQFYHLYEKWDKIEYPVLQKIQANIQEFNKNPNELKINRENIHFWTDKAKKVAAGPEIKT